MFSFVFVLFLLTSALISKQSQCLPSLPSAASLIYRMASHPSHAEHPKGYVAYKSAHPITLSGKMDDPAWAHAPWSDLFVDILGEDNDKPDHPHPWHDTRVKMMWDEECLYIGAWMEEPTPWANLTLHDSVIFRDNDFEVFIDPDSDNHNYCEIEVNANGALWDLFLAKPYREGFGPVIHNWETVASSEATESGGPTGWKPLRRAVFVDGELNSPAGGKGWGVELAIPWSLLSFIADGMSCPPKPKDKWRINFSRVHWRTRWSEEEGRYVKDPPDQNESNWVWSPMGEVAMHKPELWGYVQFSDKKGQAVVIGADAEDDETEGFIPDPSWPLRCFLMQGYKLQRELWEREGRFSSDAGELGLDLPSLDHAVDPSVQCTESSFQILATLPRAIEEKEDVEERVRRFSVNEEGRIKQRWIADKI